MRYATALTLGMFIGSALTHAISMNLLNRYARRARGAEDNLERLMQKIRDSAGRAAKK